MDETSMPSRSRVSRGVCVALTALCFATSASALDADAARSEVRQTLSGVRADMAALRSKLDAKPRVSHPPEQLIAVGELSLRTKDYDQAIDTFNQVVELYRQGKAGQNAHADGLYLLGEAYFEDGQLLSARRQYSELLDLANQAPYDSYAGRSLARLVDVALHTGRLDSLDTLRQQAARVAARDPGGSLDYARGKLEFARGNFAEARNVLATVAPASSYHHQAQYVLGAMLAKQAAAEAGAGLTPEASARLVAPPNPERFTAAVAQFKKVTELPADTSSIWPGSRSAACTTSRTPISTRRRPTSRSIASRRSTTTCSTSSPGCTSGSGTISGRNARSSCSPSRRPIRWTWPTARSCART
jgi:tetratricopeptide (TPR) repeat protein